jgi:hypothetical protein
MFTTMFENTHSVLNRKLLHLSTVVTFQNVNVAVYCQSLWFSAVMYDMMSIDITAGVGGLFCAYSQFLHATYPVCCLTMLGRSHKDQTL